LCDNPALIPFLPRPKPKPSRASHENADNNKENPKNKKPETENQYLELPFRKAKISTPFGINVEIRYEH
jgi:hypothetical protein